MMRFLNTINTQPSLPPCKSKSFPGLMFLLVVSISTTHAFVPFLRHTVNNFRKQQSPTLFGISVAEEQSAVVECTVEDVRRFTESSILHRGTSEGMESLATLGWLCSRRLSYNFNEETNECETGPVISPQRQLLPKEVTQAVIDQVKDMEKNGWLSTNPDSVDGLSSLHLNLVSNGRPSNVSNKGTSSEFQKGIETLLSLVKPHLYNDLLPSVQKLMNSDSIYISDVFIRRYGQDILDGESRNGISAHYDVFSQVTSVIALDNVAAEGTNGLYTTQVSSSPEKNGKTSNHAALRRYFPLESGDGVVHTWDVLHGVDIAPGMDRTSLIVWFSNSESDSDNSFPWISQHPNLATYNVAQFVLATATESSALDEDEAIVASHTEAMFHSDSVPSANQNNTPKHPHDLYLQSAASGNAFALTRLGSLFGEENNQVSAQLVERAVSVLNELRPTSDLPVPLRGGNDNTLSRQISNRFLFEGAVCGNPVAQVALADHLMQEAVQCREKAGDSVLLASVLFGLAAQQGHDGADDALNRVVEYELSISNVQSQQEFESNMVVQTAQAALANEAEPS